MALAELEILIAKQEITEAIYRYCRSMDRCDESLGRSVFVPEAKVEYPGMFEGSGYGFVEFAVKVHQKFLGHTHQVTNILIEVDGTRASSESYVTVTFRYVHENAAVYYMLCVGRYLDRWIRSDDRRWMIQHRRYLHEFDDNWPVFSPAFDMQGRRDRSDASYAYLTDQPLIRAFDND